MTTFILGALFALILLVAVATLVALRSYLRDTSVPDGRERDLTIAVFVFGVVLLLGGDIAIFAAVLTL